MRKTVAAIVIILGGLAFWWYYQKSHAPAGPAETEDYSAALPPKSYSATFVPESVVLLQDTWLLKEGPDGGMKYRLSKGARVDVASTDEMGITVKFGEFEAHLRKSQTDYDDRLVQAWNLDRKKKEESLSTTPAETSEKMSYRDAKNSVVINITVLKIVELGTIAVNRDSGKKLFLESRTDLKEGANYTLKGYPIGTYRYTSIVGAESQIDSWKVVSVR